MARLCIVENWGKMEFWRAVNSFLVFQVWSIGFNPINLMTNSLSQFTNFNFACFFVRSPSTTGWTARVKTWWTCLSCTRSRPRRAWSTTTSSSRARWARPTPSTAPWWTSFRKCSVSRSSTTSPAPWRTHIAQSPRRTSPTSGTRCASWCRDAIRHSSRRWCANNVSVHIHPPSLAGIQAQEDFKFVH